MVIAIIGAMPEEIKAFLGKLEERTEECYKIFTFYKGTIYNKKVIIVQSGVGKVFASMIAQHLIEKYNVEKIIFTGVAGALNKTLEIGDVIVSTSSVQHDFNATPLGFKRGQISYTEYRYFNASKELIDVAKSAIIKPHKIITGIVLTGDQFFTQRDKEEHTYLIDELKGDCIEMEGAAVAQVAAIHDIPYLIIRTVSDKANGTAVQDYNEFKHIIAENSLKVVDHILKSIK